MTQARIMTNVITRDLPLFMVSASYGSKLGESITERLGFSFDSNIVLLENGTAKIHRDNKKWYKNMPDIWSLALDDVAHSAAIRSFIDNTSVSIDKLEHIKVTPTVDCLDSFRGIVQSGMAGMIFAHWIPIYNEQKLATYKKEDVEYFERSRKEIEKFFSLAASISYELIELIGDKFNVETSLLKYATHSELVYLIEDSYIEKERLAIRREQKLLFIEDDLYLGDSEINSFLNDMGYLFEQPPEKYSASIKGTVACNGNITGKIQIINSREQFDDFQEGNILVAAMTSPDYSPLIHKSIAVITDEGGILSHAAIVCRELNKPCIIGTKFATIVLDDFQEVTLDTERGVVTVL